MSEFCRHRYSWSYVDEVVENQGKLFDRIHEYCPGIDVEKFINDYMRSKFREWMDEGHAYELTLEPEDMWKRMCNLDKYKPSKGDRLYGFMPDWIGQFYAKFQWYCGIKSKDVVDLIPVSFLKNSYNCLHDLDLQIAVEKVASQIASKQGLKLPVPKWYLEESK